jgi:predicted RNase H-like HicB family nuclease
MKHPKNYEIILRWSEDDEVFVAEVPELPDPAHVND